MKLRQMTMDDSDFMLKLKNMPETRQFAIASKEEIDRTEHLFFLEHHLQQFQAIVDEEKMVGAIRIQDNEISIWVDKEFWRKGIATYILQHVALRGMTAKIVEGNIASMKCFIRAGFEPASYNNQGYYTFKKY